MQACVGVQVSLEVLFKHIPLVGNEVKDGDWKFNVEQVKRNRTRMQVHCFDEVF